MVSRQFIPEWIGQAFVAFMVLALLLVMVLCTGCQGFHRPHSKLEVGPFGTLLKAFDSKDNDVQIKGLEIDPETGAVKVEEFTLRNNASDPIREFQGQMQIMMETHKVYGQNAAMVMEHIGGMMSQLVSLMPAVAPTEKPKDVAISSPAIVGPVLPIPE